MINVNFRDEQQLKVAAPSLAKTNSLVDNQSKASDSAKKKETKKIKVTKDNLNGKRVASLPLEVMRLWL